jgi:hypothetical protein
LPRYAAALNQETDSTITAMPCPPPMHALAMP